MRTPFLIAILLCFIASATFAQERDSAQVKVPKPPVVRPTQVTKAMRAGLLSAALPGAGQVFNKKYWKVPIVYAGAAGFGYAIGFNQKYYREYRNALIISTDGDPNTVNPFPRSNFTDQGLKRARDYYRRYRDLSVMLSFLFYGLNIADAIVDAHLSDFDVSDDLSLKFAPALQPLPNGQAAWSLSATMAF